MVPTPAFCQALYTFINANINGIVVPGVMEKPIMQNTAVWPGEVLMGTPLLLPLWAQAIHTPVQKETRDSTGCCRDRKGEDIGTIPWESVGIA